MKRPVTLFLVAASIFIVLCLSSSFAEERITLTTYYPAPYGVYRELRADQMSVGSIYRQAALNDGALIVSGNVGIGTMSPKAKLDVSGNVMVEGVKPILIKRFENKNRNTAEIKFNTEISAKDYYCFDSRWVYQEGMPYAISTTIYLQDGTWWAYINWAAEHKDTIWEIFCFRREVTEWPGFVVSSDKPDK